MITRTKGVTGMLTREAAPCEPVGRHGGPTVRLAELRSRLGDPNSIRGTHRQRLQDLAERLAAVRARRGEYARVMFSEQAAAALRCGAATV
jgi:hypothetical protein